MRDLVKGPDDQEFTNRLPFRTYLIIIFIFLILSISCMVISFFHDQFWRFIFISIYLTISLLILNYLILFFWGAITPKRIIISKKEILVKFVSPFEKEIRFEKKKIRSIEFGRITSNWPFKRYALAVNYPPDIVFIYDLPKSIIDGLGIKRTVEIESSFTYHRFVDRVHGKHPGMKRSFYKLYP